MSILVCPYCGNNNLTKSDKGDYVYYCSCCNGDVDLMSNIFIDYSDNQRCLRAAYIQLQNGKLKNALVLLEKLEQLYPNDKSVQDLRNRYEEAYSEEYNSKKLIILKKKIELFENDLSFWKHENNYISEKKLKKALDLLEDAVNNGIECPDFRYKMWRILCDVRNGRAKLYNPNALSDHELYTLFLLAANVHDAEVRIQQEREERDKISNDWSRRIVKKLNISLIIGIGMFIMSVALFFSCSKGSNARTFFVITGLISIIIILFIVLYCKINNSKNETLKKFFIETYQNEKIIAEKQNKVEKTEEWYDKLNKEYSKLEGYYMGITFWKIPEYLRKRKQGS